MIQYLRQLLLQDGVGQTDGQLLAGFIERRDEAAFAALVKRHGPLVWGVCRRLLSQHDAEDAFQATFLVLCRKAASIQRREMVASWLYGVAHQTALQARRTTARRRAREKQVVEMPEPAVVEQDLWNDLQLLLDQELSRLPGRYQVVILLCDLEGKSRKETARQLGLPEGTVASRLARARAMLAKRLARRGLAISGGTLAAALSQKAASASVPISVVSSTIKTVSLLAAGQAASVPTGVLSANVTALTDGVLKAMYLTKLKITAILLLGCTLVALVAGVLAHRASADKPTAIQPDKLPNSDLPRAEAPKQETGEQQATRLALAAHAQAAAIDKLPRFSYRVHYRHGIVDSMRAVDVSLPQCQEALTAPVLDKDWFGWYETSFSWDEKRFLSEEIPLDANLNYDFRFWTATETWERNEAKDKSSVNFVRTDTPAKFWKNLHLFDYSYLRLTPHRFWWGQTVHTDQTMSAFPPVKASWKHLGVEKFAGETCAVVESAQRCERLWISQDSRHVRGVLSYRFTRFDWVETFYATDSVQRIASKKFASQREYGNWHLWEANEEQLAKIALAWNEAYGEAYAANFPSNAALNELVRFDDYREIAPGVWLPQSEVRVVPYTSQSDKNKQLLRRTELRVQEINTERNLAERYVQLLPKEGQRVQDQRFEVAVDYDFSVNRSDEDIRKMASAEYQKRLKGQEEVKRILQPLSAMVGKPAPELPAKSWIGGKRPDLAGKPYLLHFWATWCGPCKNDLPLLKTLAQRGALVVGMHPSGTPAEEVEKVIRDQQLGYPTFLDTSNNDTKKSNIGGYPVGVFPYSVLVDAQGQVVAHGFLSEMLERGDLDKLFSSPKDDVKK